MATYKDMQSASSIRNWSLIVAILTPLALIGMAMQWANGKTDENSLSLFLVLLVAFPVSLWMFGVHRQKVERLHAILLADDDLMARFMQDAHDAEVTELRRSIERSYRDIAAAEHDGEWDKVQRLRGQIAVAESKLRELGA
ncbi:hypothetical protein IBL26_09260 [Roseomonas aerophila]|uniref:Uncharacterized protein n=1 Tax=Teichococcus aerophilus TaxID=1224513 RepID=A0ABR7RKB1_9PROT|nr:hypothetical protein [Pseudoroseomonas aerophila]MBC9207020.1 hypothetical protein [Pseudoroseomonas aerophila]